MSALGAALMQINHAVADSPATALFLFALSTFHHIVSARQFVADAHLP